MELVTEFTPLQGVILALAVVGLIFEIFVMRRDRTKNLLEIPCVLLLLDFIFFYGWLLITTPYNRNDSFLWSQLLRLHTVLTIIILAVYRISNIGEANASETVKLANIRNGFANARDGLSNERDLTANRRDELQERRDKWNG
jgi:hypothetical protein